MYAILLLYMKNRYENHTTIHIRRDQKKRLSELGKTQKRTAQAQLEVILEELFKDTDGVV